MESVGSDEKSRKGCIEFLEGDGCVFPLNNCKNPFYVSMKASKRLEHAAERRAGVRLKGREGKKSWKQRDGAAEWGGVSVHPLMSSALPSLPAPTASQLGDEPEIKKLSFNPSHCSSLMDRLPPQDIPKPQIPPRPGSGSPESPP